MADRNDSGVQSLFSTSMQPSSKQLSPEWKAVSTADQRVYFYNFRTRSSHWFPPPEFWVSKQGLPYGWEAAFDNQNRKYYIHHVTRITTREDPRSEADQAVHMYMTPPQARRIELVRDAAIGFGFVAGSEKPVVIRAVIPNGPSYDKLFANDQILRVNGEDVRDAEQEDVIKLIKGAAGSIELEVIASEDVQDSKNQHQRKSSLMSRTTRERRRSTPVSVRFADEPTLVQVIGPAEAVRRSSVPLIPNVLKVFLENGQTRSFRYDSSTTVEEVLNSFCPKLDIRSMEHFSLVLSGPRTGQISYIQNHEKVSEIYTNRTLSSVNCLCKLNITFVPKDNIDLLSQDPNVFEYLYAQMTNRVVEGFYGIDLKYDLAVKLAALHIQQKALDAAAGRPFKMSVRKTEREFGGLGRFVPSDHLDSVRGKDLRKTLEQLIKQNESLASHGEKHMSSLQCKIHYLNLASEIFSYGGKYFSVELIGSHDNRTGLRKVESQRVTLLVNWKYGVSQVIRGKVNVQCQLADFKEITGFSLCGIGEGRRLLRVLMQEEKRLELICSLSDASDLIALATGYHWLYVDNTSHNSLPVDSEDTWLFAFPRDPPADDVPEFYSKHRVVPDIWSYPSRFASTNVKKPFAVDSKEPMTGSGHSRYIYIDLSNAPPRFQESSISEELGEGNADTSKSEDQGFANQKTEGHCQSQCDMTTNPCDNKEEITTDMLNATLVEDGVLLETASSVLNNALEESGEIGQGGRSKDLLGANVEVNCYDGLASRKQDRFLSENVRREGCTVNSLKTVILDSKLEAHQDSNSELSGTESSEEREKASAVKSQPSHTEEVSVSDNSAYLSQNESYPDVRLPYPDLSSEEKKGSSFDDSSAGITLCQSDQRDQFSVGPGKKNCETSPSSSTSESQKIAGAARAPVGMPSFITDLSKDDPRVFTSQQENIHVDVGNFDDPNASTNPFRGRSLSPSLVFLGFDESEFENKENGLRNLTERERRNILLFSDERLPTGSLEQSESANSDFQSEQPPSQPQLPQTETACFAQPDSGSSDQIEMSPVNDGNIKDIVGETFIEESKKGCGEESQDADTSHSGEESDGSGESDFCEENESLSAIFPEFFTPTCKLRHSGQNKAELCLSEEDFDISHLLDLAESDQSLILLSHSEFSVRTSDEDIPREFGGEINFGGNDDKDEWEENSTESDCSDGVLYTYEVNSEPWRSRGNEAMFGEHVVDSVEKDNSDYGSIDLENESNQTTGQQNINGNNALPVVSTFLPDFHDSKERNVTMVGFSNLAESGVVYGKKVKSNSIGDMCPPSSICPADDIFLELALTSTSINEEKRLASSGDESGCLVNEVNSDSVEAVQCSLDIRYSPTEWIIPPPPTCTTELNNCDIHVVSPPPTNNDKDKDASLEEEIMGLILPPPPISDQPLPPWKSIKIVLPPAVNLEDSELLDPSSECSDVRFMSLTDDCKLAQSKMLETKRNLQADLQIEQKPHCRLECSLMNFEEEVLNGPEMSLRNGGVAEINCPIQTTEFLDTSCDLLGSLSHGFQTGVTIFSTSKTSSVVEKSNLIASETTNHEWSNSSFHYENADRFNTEVRKGVLAISTDSVVSEGIEKKGANLRQKPPIPPKPLSLLPNNIGVVNELQGSCGDRCKEIPDPINVATSPLDNQSILLPWIGKESDQHNLLTHFCQAQKAQN